VSQFPLTASHLRARRGFALAVRRVHLAFLMLWRQRNSPADEVDAQDAWLQEEERLVAERRRAGAAYHWRIASARRYEPDP
jgi:hypothetical protein